MAKDKKSAKSEGKKAKAAEKKQKQEKKADKKGKQKTARQQQQGDDDDDDVDLDQVLEAYRREQEQFLKITETVSATGPPRARSAAAFLASPANANQLLLFGGEYYNGALATFFNDLHVYYIDRDEWRTVTSPNAPLPRSGHAWCRGGHQSGAVFLFGGEFSSPKQGTFYHYNDFWRLDPAARAWTRIEGGGGTKGGGNNATPPARSGHRMTYFKQYIVLFGGFQDTAHQTRYLADLWLYDTTSFRWFSPAPATAIRPDARSSFTLLPHEQGAVLYGGYSRVKASATNKGGGKQGGGGGGGKGANNAKAGTLQAVVHQDCFLLKITPPAADAPPGTAPTVRWEQRRKPANAPSPPRAGATMAYHRGRGILFGGVHDVAESDEGLESEFFNTLWAWNIERNRFFPLALRKRRQQQPSHGAGDERRAAGGGGGRRNRAAADEEALLKQLAALEAAAAEKKTGDAGGGTGDGDNGGDGGDSGSDSENGDTADKTDKADESRLAAARNKPVSMEMPHVRFNTLLAVQGDVLYLYGGTFEKDDREFTFDDMYAVDLGKMDGCKEIFSRPLDEWIDSESEDDEDEDDDDDDDDEEEEDGDKADEKVEEPKASETESKKHTPSKRKDKRGGGPVAAAAAAAEAEAAPPPQAPADDEAEAEADAAADDDKDDGLPHPRPFESRRDFFHRTSGAWQEVLLARLRAAAGSSSSSTEEALSVKALKTKAFEMSEAKWWDCREEITALEDAQDAAGIGEVVSLADRGGGGGKRGGDGGGGGGGGSSGPRRR